MNQETMDCRLRDQWPTVWCTQSPLWVSHADQSGLHVLTKELAVRKMSKRWVLTHALLTPEHASVQHLSPTQASISIPYAKEHLFSIFQGNLHRFEEDPANLLNRSGQNKGTPLYAWNKATVKKIIKKWKHSDSHPQIKAKVVQSLGKVMVSVFSGANGILLTNFLPEGHSNWAMPCDLLLPVAGQYHCQAQKVNWRGAAPPTQIPPHTSQLLPW